MKKNFFKDFLNRFFSSFGQEMALEILGIWFGLSTAEFILPVLYIILLFFQHYLFMEILMSLARYSNISN